MAEEDADDAEELPNMAEVMGGAPIDLAAAADAWGRL